MTSKKRIGIMALSIFGLVGLATGTIALSAAPVYAKDSDSNGFKFGLGLNVKFDEKLAEMQKKIEERKEKMEEKMEKKFEKFGAFGENSSKVHALGSTLEIHINDNGSVLVRGAKVQSISGSTITATTGLGSTTLTWIVKTDGAKFSGREDDFDSISDVSVGDYLSWNGTIDSSATSLTVSAKVIKDWSAKKTVTQAPESKHTFQGKLTAIASTTLPTTMNLLIDSKAYTVNLKSGVAILGANWGAITLDKFKVGDTVRVFGGLQASSTTVIDASVVRNVNVN